MINNVVLTGRLTKDPELRYTGSGRAVAQFTLAVNRAFKSQNGQREADFINVIMWGKPAETIQQYVKKGQLIGVTGRIQTRNYENQQGQRVYVTEVVGETFTFLESSRDNNGGGNYSNGQQNYSNTSQGYASASSSTTAPANNNGNNGFDGGFTGDSPIDIPDDDLPF